MASFTALNVYLLCRQPAAWSYTEVLAHLILHFAYAGAPPGCLFTLLLGLPLYAAKEETRSLACLINGGVNESLTGHLALKKVPRYTRGKRKGT